MSTCSDFVTTLCSPLPIEAEEQSTSRPRRTCPGQILFFLSSSAAGATDGSIDRSSRLITELVPAGNRLISEHVRTSCLPQLVPFDPKLNALELVGCVHARQTDHQKPACIANCKPNRQEHAYMGDFKQIQWPPSRDPSARITTPSWRQPRGYQTQLLRRYIMLHTRHSSWDKRQCTSNIFNTMRHLKKKKKRKDQKHLFGRTAILRLLVFSSLHKEKTSNFPTDLNFGVTVIQPYLAQNPQERPETSFNFVHTFSSERQLSALKPIYSSVCLTVNNRNMHGHAFGFGCQQGGLISYQ